MSYSHCNHSIISTLLLYYKVLLLDYNFINYPFRSLLFRHIKNCFSKNHFFIPVLALKSWYFENESTIFKKGRDYYLWVIFPFQVNAIDQSWTHWWYSRSLILYTKVKLFLRTPFVMITDFAWWWMGLEFAFVSIFDVKSFMFRCNR